MRTESYDLLRRDVRTAVFRAGRLRAEGDTARADEQLADELAAAHARLAAEGTADAAAVVRQWVDADEAAFAQAHLTTELLLERLPRPEAGAARPPDSLTPPSAPAPTRAPGAVPGLADLLDDMLGQERRAKPRPS